ncbi:MAG: PAS-domain containing protein [Alphaproteobacteria bacterium]|nr:PAS-domain containing protein [Alphaproteobacteria bacterium]
MESPELVWPYIAFAGCVAAAVLGMLLWRMRNARRRAEARVDRLQALLEDSPYGVIRCRPEGWRPNPAAAAILKLDPDRLVPPDQALARFADRHREAIRESAAAMIRDGRPFEMTVDTDEEGLVLTLCGRSVEGDAAIWLRDDSASAWLAEQYTEREDELALLRGVLDTVTHPVWWRDRDSLTIAGHNRAFRDMFGGDERSRSLGAPERATELARLAQRTGLPQSESRHIVLGGDRHAMDVLESPVPGHQGIVAGMAQDMTALENLQMTLAEHIAVQDQVLERLTSAIAIFGPDRRLKFFNPPYADMWRLSHDVLDDQPVIGTLLELLRENRQLPEMSDFPAFKRQMEQLFTALIEPREDLLHLPDGRTVRAVASPHPLGGLIFQYEDVTDRLALESSHNTLTAVQRSTLNSLFEGVCVFGRDGRLKLFNDVYAGLFGLDPAWLATEPHISEVANYAKGMLRTEEDWESLRRRLITSVSEPAARQGRMNLVDGRVMDYAYVPLPDGQCLVLYLDITDSTQVERALRERNRALENADLLKSRFVSNVSYELRTPLNAIMGFAELLRLETFGTLTERQKAYVNDILVAASDLSDLIGDILDLAAVQAGFMQLESVEIDLAAMMPEVCELVLRDRPLTARLTFAKPTRPGRVLADRRRLFQALHYLIADAARHAPTGPEAAIELTEEAGRPAIRMTVPLTLADDSAWASRASGSPDLDIVEHALATGADIGISLARSLIHAQKGRMEVAEDGVTLICSFEPAD